MAALAVLNEVFDKLYWPHAAGSKPAPDGSIGLFYEWRCGCSAMTLDSHKCIISWCDKHGPQHPPQGER